MDLKNVMIEPFALLEKDLQLRQLKQSSLKILYKCNHVLITYNYNLFVAH